MFDEIHIDFSLNASRLILKLKNKIGASMLNVPNSYVNFIIIFTSSRITNYVCLIHIQYIFDKRIDNAILN